MKRLTVHLENQPTIDIKNPEKENKKSTISAYERSVEQGKLDKAKLTSVEDKKQFKGRFKTYTTITIRDLKDDKDIEQALSNIRSKYTIAKCKDSKRSYWNVGDEMYHTAYQK